MQSRATRRDDTRHGDILFSLFWTTPSPCCLTLPRLCSSPRVVSVPFLCSFILRSLSLVGLFSFGAGTSLVSWVWLRASLASMGFVRPGPSVAFSLPVCACCFRGARVCGLGLIRAVVATCGDASHSAPVWGPGCRRALCHTFALPSPLRVLVFYFESRPGTATPLSAELRRRHSQARRVLRSCRVPSLLGFFFCCCFQSCLPLRLFELST